MESHYNCADTDASEIIPNLWIGNYKAAANKKFMINNNIGFVVNSAMELPNFFKSSTDTMAPKYLNVPLQKDRCYLNMRAYFLKSTKFIFDGLSQNKAVLVHSKDGSRAAVIVAAFLIHYIGLDYVESIVYINSIRKCAMIKNTCLLNQLFKFFLNLQSHRLDH